MESETLRLWPPQACWEVIVKTGLRLERGWLLTLECFGDYGFLPDRAKLLSKLFQFPR